jgi:hypothetical protein
MEQTMLLKQRIIQDIESLPNADLLVIQQMIRALTAVKPLPRQTRGKAYLATREALQNCGGSWAQDILQQREDRL